MKTKATSKMGRPVLSPEDEEFEKTQASHKLAVRSVFRFAGFRRVAGAAHKTFTSENQTTDVDDIFIYQNIIVIAEYTCHQSSSVGNHLKNKKIVYDKIVNKPHQFIERLKSKFPDAAAESMTPYHYSQKRPRILYCSRYPLDEHYKINVPEPIYMDYPAVRYFSAIGDAGRLSLRYELFNFLKIEPKHIGTNGKITVAAMSKDYQGTILPEAHSHFDSGFKIVTFYVDPDALFKTAYVLRKDGWRKNLINLYQRMISKDKIEFKLIINKHSVEFLSIT